MASGHEYRIVEAGKGSFFTKVLIILLFLLVVALSFVAFFSFPYVVQILNFGTDPIEVSQNTQGNFVIENNVLRTSEEFYALFTQNTEERSAEDADPILEYTTDFYNYRSEYYDRCEARKFEIDFTNQKTSSVSFNYQDKIITYNVNVYDSIYEFTDNLKNQDCYFRGDYVDGYFDDPYNTQFMNVVANDLISLRGTYTDDELVEIATLLSQAITYGTDETQLNRYPYETFYEGVGNCLDKSVILVYLLEKLNYTTYIVLGQSTEYHALVGIECDKFPNLRVGNKDVCFIETTAFLPIGSEVEIEVEKVVPMSDGNKVYGGVSYGSTTVGELRQLEFEIETVNNQIKVASDNLKIIEQDMCGTDCVICINNEVDFERSNNEISTCNDATIYNLYVIEYNDEVNKFNDLVQDWYDKYYQMENIMFENVEFVQR